MLYLRTSFRAAQTSIFWCNKSISSINSFLLFSHYLIISNLGFCGSLISLTLESSNSNSAPRHKLSPTVPELTEDTPKARQEP
jgi:hypothetical protein